MEKEVKVVDTPQPKKINDIKVLSPGRLVAKRFFRSKLSIIGLVIILSLFVFSFLGPFVSPLYAAYDIPRFVYYSNGQQIKNNDGELLLDRKDIEKQYLATIEASPEFSLDKFPNEAARNKAITNELNSKMSKVVKGLNDLEIRVFPVDREVIAVNRYERIDENGEVHFYYEVSKTIATFKAPPSDKHWLGTDPSGMDVLVRLMYGGRISLTIGFLAVFLELFFGVVLGGIAGYFGKWLDQLIMRIVDVFNCLPGLPILLIASSILIATEVPGEQRIYYLLGILAFFGWAGIARLVRGQILSLREQEFMIAAEATGISAPRKIFKHLIPNVMPQLIVSATLGLGGIILYESTLSYLGLGVPFPNASWGGMIGLASPTTGREILANYPNIWVPPGICIVLAVLAFNFIGDGLRDAFDPKMKR